VIQANRWHETAIDTRLFFQLQDLTTVLSKLEYLSFDYTYGSYIDPENKILTASTLWESTPSSIQDAGYKTDVYLRALGSLHDSNLQTLIDIHTHLDELKLRQFALQLFTLLEDIRLEEAIKKKRPGTVKDFSIRTNYLRNYFQSQLVTMITRGRSIEALYCMIFLQIRANTLYPEFPLVDDQLFSLFDSVKTKIMQTFDAQTTDDNLVIALNVANQLASSVSDMKHVYFTFPIYNVNEDWLENSLFYELTRTDDLANFDKEELDPEKNEYIDETLSTWHRENENSDRQQTFLQMDLDVGTKTNLTGGTARETESGDQVFGAAQGHSRQAGQKDYSKLESLDRHEESQHTGKPAPYGLANIKANRIDQYASNPTIQQTKDYEDILHVIEPYKRKLAQSIEKWIEHKRSTARSNLSYGRLSNKLLHLVTEDDPKIFYKKDENDREFDAVFTLMIDCSASMHNKMEETKHGIALFHEVLKQLKIPHNIVGFWEAATTHQDQQQPNYFHWIHQFSDSLYDDLGARIMQLEAEEDNRDGYSIRVVADEKKKRSEKHKFLLVFSDGEPAAANYEQTGIIDTHQAVTETRKENIDVIGMFLADGQASEADDVLMENIYGESRVIVNQVSELPDFFSPILKKLLMKLLH